MGKFQITDLPKSQVQIKFTVTPEEAKPFVDQAVTDISMQKPIKGFRPGKATYADVAREYGEMLIWETALERIVRAEYVKTILEHDIDTLGSPGISVDKLVPNQEIEFTATATVMPKAIELMNYSQPLVELKKRSVTEAEADQAIEELRRMRRTEAAVDRAATPEDMVMVDLEILKEKVPVEGGTSRDYRVLLSEPHYIPGFAEKLIGAKKGDKLEFTLEFPKEHYTKQLAGQPADFKVEVKEIFELKKPELNEAFAKSLGIESVDELRKVMLRNLQEESDQKAEEAAEIELLEKLVKGSRFSELPDNLVNAEVHRMLHELEDGLEEQGMNMEHYLSSLKKTRDQLMLDFVPRAMDRIRTAILIREIAKREDIKVTEEEIDHELDHILERIKPNDKETRERITSANYRDYIAAQLRNRKTLSFLKEKGIKKNQ
jgi:trigger factor